MASLSLRAFLPSSKPSELEPATPSSPHLDALVSLCVWAMALLYTAVFCAMSFRRYDAYLMHALDMGNMEQVIWNTFHGNPFHFTNMRDHLRVEAFGTDTRLSFHVEPILLPLSVIDILRAGPKALLVLQTAALASGAFAARRLARRHLAPSRAAQVIFPLAYLLYPAMQAANLYEFHPVTLAAPLLIWALDFADLRRPLPFALFGVAAVGTKEEMGLVVALMALWSVRRGMPLKFALAMAVLCAAWSFIAVLVIVPAAQRAEHSTITTSPYLTRYLNRDLTAPGKYVQVTAGTVLKYWVSHPKELADNVLGVPKLGYMHRLLVPAGYLSLLSPLTLLISLPSFLIIIFSTDQHMYGGLGHYSAEFVGVLIASAVFGLARLASYLETRGWARRRVITAGSVFLLLISLSNSRVNGFGPLDDSFEWPALTTHVRLTDRMLAMIPPDAPVSAQDTLDPHLSDRAGAYLFPDTADAQYVALDASANPIPSTPDDLHSMVLSMLASKRWDVLFANDGLLLLRRRSAPSRTAPVLPPAFYTFALKAHPAIQYPLRVIAADGLEMLGYTITRRETVNLRMPDVVLTTFWRADRPVLTETSLPSTVTNEQGDFHTLYGENTAALDWLPTAQWKPGRVISVTTVNMGIAATLPGTSRACFGVFTGHQLRFSPEAGLSLRVAQSSGASGWVRLEANGHALCVGTLPVIF
jgi:uncharacterized membrane protein